MSNQTVNKKYKNECESSCELCDLIFRPEKKQKIDVSKEVAGEEVKLSHRPSPLTKTYIMTIPDEIKLDTKPNLIRSLSEHHWQAAEIALIQTKAQTHWAGSFYGLNNEDKWEYWISRLGNTLIRHSRSSDGAYSESIIPLRRPTRCEGINVKRTNKTGKGENKPSSRCKNKCYGQFCVRHQITRLSPVPCSYIA
jgi:hypothetical protein